MPPVVAFERERRVRGQAEFGWDEAPAKGGKGNGTEPGAAA